MRLPSIHIRLGSLTHVKWKPRGDHKERGTEPTPRVEGMGIERFTPNTRPGKRLLPASPALLGAGGSGHTPSPAHTCAPAPPPIGGPAPCSAALGSSGWQAEGPVPGSGRSQGRSRAAEDLERLKLHQGKSQPLAGTFRGGTKRQPPSHSGGGTHSSTLTAPGACDTVPPRATLGVPPGWAWARGSSCPGFPSESGDRAPSVSGQAQGLPFCPPPSLLPWDHSGSRVALGDLRRAPCHCSLTPSPL